MRCAAVVELHLQEPVHLEPRLLQPGRQIPLADVGIDDLAEHVAKILPGLEQHGDREGSIDRILAVVACVVPSAGAILWGSVELREIAGIGIVEMARIVVVLDVPVIEIDLDSTALAVEAQHGGRERVIEGILADPKLWRIWHSVDRQHVAAGFVESGEIGDLNLFCRILVGPGFRQLTRKHGLAGIGPMQLEGSLTVRGWHGRALCASNQVAHGVDFDDRQGLALATDQHLAGFAGPGIQWHVVGIFGVHSRTRITTDARNQRDQKHGANGNGILHARNVQI